MTLPPLANLFAFSSPDPRELDEVALDLEGAGRFAAVWRPDGRWVVAEAPLPFSPPPLREVRDAGLVFVEGRHLAVRDGHAGDDIARLTGRVRSGRAVEIGGDVGFVWFRDDGSAEIVRSCGGRVPFYLWESGERIGIATLQSHLLEFTPGDLGIDPLAHATWMTRWCFTTDDRSLVAGARVVPAGFRCVAAPGTTARFERYWEPRPDRLPVSSQHGVAEAAAALREELVAHLAAELHPDGGNLLSLSGGVDSSALGALAAGPAQRPISTTVSLVPPPGPGRAYEFAYIEPLADRIGVRHRIFQDGDPASIDRLYREAPASFVPRVHPVLCVLSLMSDETDVRTYLGGEFCDDLFGLLVLHDWNESVSPWRALRCTGRPPHGRGSLLRWGRDRALGILGRPHAQAPRRLPTPVQRRHHDAYAEWRERERRAMGADRKPRRYMVARLPKGLSWVEMNWELASPAGIRRVLPFTTRTMIELAASLHPADVLSDGPKTLLRTGLAGDVPARNLERPDKGGWGRHLERPPMAVPTPLPEAAAAVLDEQWLESPPREASTGTAWPVLHLGRSLEECDRLRAGREKRLPAGRGS